VLERLWCDSRDEQSKLRSIWATLIAPEKLKEPAPLPTPPPLPVEPAPRKSLISHCNLQPSAER